MIHLHNTHTHILFFFRLFSIIGYYKILSIVPCATRRSLLFTYPIYAAAAAKLLQSCPTLCNPIDGSPPGSPVPGILQARTLEWVAISSSNAWKWKVKVKFLSRVRLFVTHGLQPTRLLLHGIFQARLLEWVAIAFSNPIYSSVYLLIPNS